MLSLATLKLALLVSAVVVSGTDVEYTCKWKTNNATYDLCPLQLSSQSIWPYYEVFDNKTKNNLRNFSYVFNVAGDIVEQYPAESCYNEALRDNLSLPDGYCPTFNDDQSCAEDIVFITENTAAYQVYRGHNHEQTCFRLHNGETPPQWNYRNSEDPTEGVILTYLDGDYCSGAHKNREMRLEFECANTANNYPDKEEVIVEEPSCVYTIKIKSVHGCPTECPTVNEELCSGKGICEFDFTHSSAACFCYTGYYGTDCASTSDPDLEIIYEDNDEKYVSGLVIVVILLVIVLAILCYLWMRFQRVTQQPQVSVQRYKKKQQTGKTLLAEEVQGDPEQPGKHSVLTSVDEHVDHDQM